MHVNISSCVQVVWKIRKYQRAFHLHENASEIAQIYHEIPELPHMRRSISPEFRLVYNPLNMSICMRIFPLACRSCKRSVSTKERFTLLKMRPKLQRSTMKFSQLPDMRRSISTEFRLASLQPTEHVYMHENISSCVQVVSEVRKYQRAFHLLENASETAQIYHEILPTSTHAQKYITWI